MKIDIQPLRSTLQTGRKINQHAKRYWYDLDKTGDLDKTLKQFYDKVRAIPYAENHIDEIVARPKILLNSRIFPALDCKKKTVLMSAWLEAHGHDWRLVTNSELPSGDIHHIFPQTRLDDGEYYNVDATYPEYELFSPKPETTNAEELVL